MSTSASVSAIPPESPNSYQASARPSRRRSEWGAGRVVVLTSPTPGRVASRTTFGSPVSIILLRESLGYGKGWMVSRQRREGERLCV